MWWSCVAYSGTAMLSWMLYCSLGSVVLPDPLAWWSLLLYPLGLLYMGVAFVVARLQDQPDEELDGHVLPTKYLMLCAVSDSFSFYITPMLVFLCIRIVSSLVTVGRGMIGEFS